MVGVDAAVVEVGGGGAAGVGAGESLDADEAVAGVEAVVVEGEVAEVVASAGVDDLGGGADGAAGEGVGL